MTTDEAMAAARDSAQGSRVDRLLLQLAERIGARAGVEAVFGPPIQSGEVTVVPVARVRWGVGGGGGESATDRASGSGGGGGVAADPVGYLEIRPTGAQFQPIASPYPSPAFILSAAVAATLVLRALARLR